ncbi:hypothetical protein GGF37_004804 [Kickxella alabastrina]|nr:hypothetical protein GGF37_004804 [Kickxella alabastrina]
MHLSGIGNYWRVTAVALIVHVVYYKLVPVLSMLLLPKVYGRMTKSEKQSWDIGFISLPHTIFDSWLIISHFNSPALNENRMDGYDTHFEHFLPWVLGYYIWDMFICLTNLRSYGFTYLIHAFLGVFGILVLTSRQLQFYAIPFLLPELSSVFLNIRHIMKSARLSDSLVYKANFMLFLITYVGIRIGYEMYQSFGLAVAVYRGEIGNVYYPFAVYFAVLGITLTVLNFIWLKQIINAAQYMLFGKSKDSKKTE